MRLRKRSQYLGVQRNGRKVQSDHFLLLIAATDATHPQPPVRIGVTISSKVGNAVVRNRLKRWVREHLRRRLAEDLPRGDLVIIGKMSAAACTHEVIDQDLARLMIKGSRGRT